MKTTVDKDENEIVDAYNNHKLKKASNEEELKKMLLTVSKNTLKKMEEIKIQLPAQEIHLLKVKSLESGVPIDAIISALVHNYLGNKISITV